ncbi:MAG: hypothetical protein ACREFE_10830 [Limisphaerales bacterium]
MQTIKGLGALLFVALVVFAAVETYNRMAEANYVPQWEKNVVASTAKTTKQVQADESEVVKTNKIARHKIKNENL